MRGGSGSSSGGVAAAVSVAGALVGAAFVSAGAGTTGVSVGGTTGVVSGTVTGVVGVSVGVVAAGSVGGVVVFGVAATTAGAGSCFKYWAAIKAKASLGASISIQSPLALISFTLSPRLSVPKTL